MLTRGGGLEAAVGMAAAVKDKAQLAGVVVRGYESTHQVDGALGEDTPTGGIRSMQAGSRRRSAARVRRRRRSG